MPGELMPVAARFFKYEDNQKEKKEGGGRKSR